MAKILQNIQKNSVLGPSLTLFAQIWTKMNFPGIKKALPVFKYSNYLPLCQKSEKINESFLRKMPNCWTGRQKTVNL